MDSTDLNWSSESEIDPQHVFGESSRQAKKFQNLTKFDFLRNCKIHSRACVCLVCARTMAHPKHPQNYSCGSRGPRGNSEWDLRALAIDIVGDACAWKWLSVTVLAQIWWKRYLGPQTENFDFSSKSPNASMVHIGPQNQFYWPKLILWKRIWTSEGTSGL